MAGEGGPYPPLLPLEDAQAASTAPNTTSDNTAPGGTAVQTHERYYLRSLGANPRKEAAHMGATFPQLAADVRIPDLFPHDALFSTVLRISSPGLRLWTHYDVMDNLLIQVRSGVCDEAV